jgi:hypothetical protein
MAWTICCTDGIESTSQFAKLYRYPVSNNNEMEEK